MKSFTIYLAVLTLLAVSKLSAQETFEAKAHAIAVKIENVTNEEKAALKYEIEAVNQDLEKGLINKEQAEERKLKLAEIRSKNIETRVGQAQEELKNLVKQKVDGKIKETNNKGNYYFNIGWKVKDSIRRARGESRTTSQFVFAIGANNLVTDGSIANSDFKYIGSRFYEWGFTANRRLFKNDNLLHLKYGFSVISNDLRPTDNRVFVTNGNQTSLEEYSIKLRDSRFRNVYLTLPLHFEFDFTKPKENDGKKIFRTHESFRFGIGGYAGIRVKSKQKICYTYNDRTFTQKEVGDFNANDFIYGVSTYIGYKETSLYLKYDLNPLFKDNAIKQNNISLGVRFDFN